MMLMLLWMIWLQTVSCEERHVEITVYVDEMLNLQLTNKNMDVVTYVEDTMSIVNLIYSNIRPEIHFAISNIWIEGVNHGPLDFITNVLFTNKTDIDIALHSMELWVEENVDNHADIVLTFTGLNLCRHPTVKEDFTPERIDRYYRTFHKCNCSFDGMAFLGGACNTSSVGIVKNKQDSVFKTAITTAHEIGHLLNLTHDGELLCSDSDRYVMSRYGLEENLLTFIQRTSNGSLWSPCSKEQFNKYMHNFKCLQNKPEEEKDHVSSNLFIFIVMVGHMGLFWKLEGWLYCFEYVIGNNFSLFCCTFMAITVFSIMKKLIRCHVPEARR